MHFKKVELWNFWQLETFLSLQCISGRNKALQTTSLYNWKSWVFMRRNTLPKFRWRTNGSYFTQTNREDRHDYPFFHIGNWINKLQSEILTLTNFKTKTLVTAPNVFCCLVKPLESVIWKTWMPKYRILETYRKLTLPHLGHVNCLMEHFPHLWTVTSISNYQSSLLWPSWEWRIPLLN